MLYFNNPTIKVGDCQVKLSFDDLTGNFAVLMTVVEQNRDAGITF